LIFVGFGWALFRLYPEGLDRLETNPFYYGWGPYLDFFLFLLAIHLTTNFFNSAIIACVALRFSGQDPNLFSGFEYAFKRFSKVLLWSFGVSLFVFLMDFFKKGWIRRLIGNTIEMAFKMASFFVMPIMVNEAKGPWTAFCESVSLLEKTWGKQIAGNFSFFLIFFWIELPSFILIWGGATNFGGLMSFQESFRWGFLGSGGLWLAFVLAIQRTLMEVFRTSLYVWVRYGAIPEGFDEEILRQSIKPKLEFET
jgi:hypothetical protein